MPARIQFDTDRLRAIVAENPKASLRVLGEKLEPGSPVNPQTVARALSDAGISRAKRARRKHGASSPAKIASLAKNEPAAVPEVATSDTAAIVARVERLLSIGDPVAERLAMALAEVAERALRAARP